MSERTKNNEAPSLLHPPTQSRGLSTLLKSYIPAFSALSHIWSETFPSVLFKRGKEERLYDIDGNKYLDFDLDQGRLLFGHAPAFLTTPIKNSISLGALENHPTLSLSRFYSALKSVLPGLDQYDLFFVPDTRAAQGMFQAAYPGWDPVLPEMLVSKDDASRLESRIDTLQGGGNPLLLDEGISFLCLSAKSFIEQYNPEGAVINGILGLPLLLLKPGHALRPVPWLPPQHRIITALEMLRAVRGSRSPYSHLSMLATHFKNKFSGTISDWRGFSPKINITNEQRETLLRAGYFLNPTGYIHFCTCHTEKCVARLADNLNQL